MLLDLLVDLGLLQGDHTKLFLGIGTDMKLVVPIALHNNIILDHLTDSPHNLHIPLYLSHCACYLLMLSTSFFKSFQ